MKKHDGLPDGKDGLTRLLRDIGTAAKVVNSEVNKAGLTNLSGSAGLTNIHGEEQKKLDVFANYKFISTLRAGGECCILASEENEQPVLMDPAISESAVYVVALDPLDGSSNIDVGVPVGTIFAIYRRNSSGGPAGLNDILQQGREQVAAGYIIYGSSTMLVYTVYYGDSDHPVSGQIDPGVS